MGFHFSHVSHFRRCAREHVVTTCKKQQVLGPVAQGHVVQGHQLASFKSIIHFVEKELLENMSYWQNESEIEKKEGALKYCLLG